MISEEELRGVDRRVSSE